MMDQCGGRRRRQVKEVAKWSRGSSYYKLTGPQPWQCTRPFIVRHVYELLVAEGYDDWLVSDYRWRELERVMRPTIKCNLSIWKPQIFGGEEEVVEEYSKRVWERYKGDYLMRLKGGEEALVPLQIGFAYVCDLGERSDWPILRESGGGGGEVVEAVEGGGGEEEVDDSETAEVTPHPEVVCLPVVEANDNDDDESFVEEAKWTCDFCSAIFSDYDEAVTHENGCKMNSNATTNDEGGGNNEAVGTSSKTKESDEYVIEEEWKCDYCGTPFRSYDEAVAHEDECRKTSNVTKIVDEEDKGDATRLEKSSSAQSVSVQNDNSDKENKEDAEMIVIDDDEQVPEQRGDYIYQEKWKCDYCSASFPSYDDAVTHENKCYVRVKSAADDNASAGNENKTSDESDGVDYVMEEQWNCDFCDAHFGSLGEATAHEAVCTKALETSTSKPAGYNSTGESENVTDFLFSNEYRSSMLKVLEKLHYEYFPFMSGGSKKMDEVCVKVLRSMHVITPLTGDFSERDVESVLNQLEYESGYLTVLNNLLRVRVKMKLLNIDEPPPKISTPPEKVDNTPVRMSGTSLAETENHAEFVATLDTNEQVTAATMPKESEPIATKETILKRRFDAIVLSLPSPCGVCILCSAPDCERCSVCLSDCRTETDICIRKMCCNIPFEFKAKDVAGFPHGWQYAFCDPTQGLLVKSLRQITSLAGLVLRRPLPPTASKAPKYEYFNSLEAAFLAVRPDSTEAATTLLESFFAEIYGPDAIRSYPNHFLLGKRCCFEFTNANGRNVAMFGVISNCFRENSEAEHDIFIVQYDSDCIKVAAKTLGTTVSRLQLISAGQAWGGCVSFERKSCIRCHPSVCSTVDQATSVEYWVTPSMRMEELVEQSNGVKTPQLTIFLRGYKFVFTSNTQGSSVFVTCTSMCDIEGEIDESVLKPGELIDLGVVSPLIDTDTKSLPVFILKNYIHNFAINAYVEDGNGYVHDLTNAATGLMHLVAAKKVLSYVRSCCGTETPTIHYGRDPSGNIHLLFGLQYVGDWNEYANAVENELQPIFRGVRKEVTLSHNDLIGEDREERYLSTMSNFSPHELEQCSRFFRSLSLKASKGALSSEVKKRFTRVGTLLRNRIAELKYIPSMDEVDKRIRVSIDKLNVR